MAANDHQIVGYLAASNSSTKKTALQTRRHFSMPDLSSPPPIPASNESQTLDSANNTSLVPAPIDSQTLDSSNNTPFVHMIRRESDAFNINYPDSRTPSSHHAQASLSQAPPQRLKQCDQNHSDCNSPSQHSQDSVPSGDQTPRTPVTPHKTRKKAPHTAAILPHHPKRNALSGRLLPAWQDFQTHPSGEIQNSDDAESAKLREENEVLRSENTALRQTLQQNEKNIEELVGLLRVAENSLLASQREHQADLQQKQEYYAFWQSALAKSRGTQLNLSALPTSQSRSATGTPVSDTSTEQEGNSASNPRDIPRPLSACSTFLAACCCVKFR